MTAVRNELSDLTLERYLADDLAPADAERVRRALDESPSLKARVDAMRRENAEILLQHPPRRMAPEILRRAGVARSTPRRVVAFAAPLAVGLAAFAIFVKPAGDPAQVNEAQLAHADTTRTKGITPLAAIDHTPTATPQLHVYRRAGAIVEELAPGATVRAGDTLQLAYASLGNGYGVVLSLDGRGGVTLHHPERAGEPQRLLPSGEVSLPRAYALDDAPGFERFLIVGSDAPIDVDAVLAGARALAREPDRASHAFLELPAGMRQNSFTLRKERP